MHSCTLACGIGRVNRLGKAAQAVDAGHEDVTQPTVLQIRQTGEPELGALVLASHKPQQFLLALEIHA